MLIVSMLLSVGSILCGEVEQFIEQAKTGDGEIIKKESTFIDSDIIYYTIKQPGKSTLQHMPDLILYAMYYSTHKEPYTAGYIY